MRKPQIDKPADLTFEDLEESDDQPTDRPAGWRRLLGMVLVVAFVTYTMARAAGWL